MKITVSVTAEDIRNGRRTHCSACPVALAIMRALSITDINVGPDDMDLGQGTQIIDVPTPLHAALFIRDYDRGELVEPFSFELEVPDALVPAEVAR